MAVDDHNIKKALDTAGKKTAASQLTAYTPPIVIATQHQPAFMTPPRERTKLNSTYNFRQHMQRLLDDSSALKSYRSELENQLMEKMKNMLEFGGLDQVGLYEELPSKLSAKIFAKLLLQYADAAPENSHNIKQLKKIFQPPIKPKTLLGEDVSKGQGFSSESASAIHKQNIHSSYGNKTNLEDRKIYSDVSGIQFSAAGIETAASLVSPSLKAKRVPRSFGNPPRPERMQNGMIHTKTAVGRNITPPSTSRTRAALNSSSVIAAEQLPLSTASKQFPVSPNRKLRTTPPSGMSNNTATNTEFSLKAQQESAVTLSAIRQRPAPIVRSVKKKDVGTSTSPLESNKTPKHFVTKTKLHSSNMSVSGARPPNMDHKTKADSPQSVVQKMSFSPQKNHVVTVDSRIEQPISMPAMAGPSLNSKENAEIIERLNTLNAQMSSLLSRPQAVPPATSPDKAKIKTEKKSLGDLSLESQPVIDGLKRELAEKERELLAAQAKLLLTKDAQEDYNNLLDEVTALDEQIKRLKKEISDGVEREAKAKAENLRLLMQRVAAFEERDLMRKERDLMEKKLKALISELGLHKSPVKNPLKSPLKPQVHS